MSLPLWSQAFICLCTYDFMFSHNNALKFCLITSDIMCCFGSGRYTHVYDIHKSVICSINRILMMNLQRNGVIPRLLRCLTAPSRAVVGSGHIHKMHEK